MKTISQAIPDSLRSMDITKSSDENLPELTPDERNAAVMKEARRRALILGVPVAEVKISEEKLKELIHKERVRKYTDMISAEYWKKVDSMEKTKSHTAEQFYALFLQKASKLIDPKYRKKYIVDEFNQAIIKKLCLYFTNDPRSEQYGLDRNKGLLLMGNTGTGKTLIMRAFATNMLASFRVKRTVDISYDFVDHGLQVIKMHGEPERIPEDIYGHATAGICYDDMGNEDERRRYGDKVNVMADIIGRRYDMLDHNLTHVTTNLNPSAIEEVYGIRIRSRMAEMFNVISFDKNCPDRRRL